MNGFELNKIAASILLAGLVAMIAGKVADILYRPNFQLEKRGYNIAIEEDKGDTKVDKPIEIVKIGQLMAKADLKAGEENSKKCAVCHNFVKDGPNKVGPDLWNIVESQRGHHPGFAYSDAMLAKSGSWTYEDLYHFLKSPRNFIPGTKMGFAGFKKSEDIANTIMYLRSLSDTPKDLPQIEP